MIDISNLDVIVMDSDGTPFAAFRNITLAEAFAAERSVKIGQRGKTYAVVHANGDPIARWQTGRRL